MKKIALLLARFFNSLRMFVPIHALWGLISGFIEKKVTMGNPLVECRLTYRIS